MVVQLQACTRSRAQSMRDGPTPHLGHRVSDCPRSCVLGYVGTARAHSCAAGAVRSQIHDDASTTRTHGRIILEQSGRRPEGLWNQIIAHHIFLEDRSACDHVDFFRVSVTAASVVGEDFGGDGALGIARNSRGLDLLAASRVPPQSRQSGRSVGREHHRGNEERSGSCDADHDAHRRRAASLS